MDEQEEKTTTEEKPVENPKEGVQPESTKLIDKANAAAERTEKAVEELKKENDRKENLVAQEKLSGRADAGKQSEKPEPLTDREYAKKFRAGDIPIDEVLKP